MVVFFAWFGGFMTMLGIALMREGHPMFGRGVFITLCGVASTAAAVAKL